MKVTKTPGFGSVLRELRLHRKLSQSQLARRAGMSNSHISRLESDGRTPSRETVRIIAQALSLQEGDIRFDRLYESSGYSGYDKTFSCDEIYRLSRIYLDSTPEIQAEIRSTLQIVILGVIRRGNLR